MQHIHEVADPGRDSRPNRAQRRRRGAVGVTAAVISASMFAGVGMGTAGAVAPSTVRSSAGCSYASSAEQAKNVQTCHVWSESMQSYVTVKVRPSDQLPGQQEQAVYFLGGIDDGTQQGGIADEYATKYTLVTIVGNGNAWSSNWQELPVDADGNTLTNASGGTYNPQWETFIGEELPAYLDQNFDVDQTGNAIVGLSISGGQAINIALKYPEVFKVAHSISGYYQTDNPIGYVLIPYVLSQRMGVANGLDGMWGNPFRPGNVWADNDLALRIIQAKDNGQIVIVSAGTGIIGSAAEFDELWGLGGPGEVIFGSALEAVSFISAVLLNAVAVVTGAPVRFNYTMGAHTWTHWNANKATEAGMVQDALSEFETGPKVGASTAVTEAATVADVLRTSSGDPAPPVSEVPVEIAAPASASASAEGAAAEGAASEDAAADGGSSVVSDPVEPAGAESSDGAASDGAASEGPGAESSGAESWAPESRAPEGVDSGAGSGDDASDSDASGSGPSEGAASSAGSDSDGGADSADSGSSSD
ncbi:alpha/beta hydrolase-fold protein [Gordonia sp. ABSL11-1]|uniref:alpha/beta hydrolase n=1 Tax=Gordonia sp. ABSL11-1 TaxID=3053924 RepID=UPI00257261B2|nr:alpha/beta hydrolase-fold protein [Gordonia sp. ABSL11-1]MDL9948873.1 alpha/beta hydrolase-fold protein [Gordonia sp. ABSL11-1]